VVSGWSLAKERQRPWHRYRLQTDAPTTGRAGGRGVCVNVPTQPTAQRDGDYPSM